MENWLNKLKNKLVDTWYDFVDLATANQKRSLIYAGSLLAFVTISTIIMILLQPGIRKEEVESLVYPAIHSSKVKFFEEDADKVIKESKAISVMYSKPDGQSYESVISLLNDSKAVKELNRTVYFYPIVYKSKQLEEKYSIDSNQVTFVFYENGVEKNRFAVENLKDFDKEFIPELNRLPMWNITDLQQTSQSTTESSSQ
ncbi:hypothetical protein RV11_GL000492 [Enterococcus phoeniculicola]|jgi:hypothetical protein|uniref:Uncharacterized protein n=1 Tax=Enterococcus phoeniculicola ATCC BAA-412 TaxID=1158610 RepID=R3TYH1_9ENTE|nr:hypothetical protein [Enterococcus phoeniculicola]EOL46208.1 hypothetical protein UC3_01014 [Enterococcus phoeniculicola ATCC BAA-412]EOT76947.1 hypothetical protein I589_01908 [Enterococcus phoeniculicola ATCC BAA-412]OJG71202.1 hypothetical protein RV11_GL000492 [Enterococcus phoeniculicola]